MRAVFLSATKVDFDGAVDFSALEAIRWLADEPRLPESRRASTTRFSTVRPVERDADGVWRVTRDFRID